MKYINDVETEKCSLEVYECSCGFHIGFDTSYLDQVGCIEGHCPSCNQSYQIPGYDEGK